MWHNLLSLLLLLRPTRLLCLRYRNSRLLVKWIASLSTLAFACQRTAAHEVGRSNSKSNNDNKQRGDPPISARYTTSLILSACCTLFTSLYVCVCLSELAVSSLCLPFMCPPAQTTNLCMKCLGLRLRFLTLQIFQTKSSVYSEMHCCAMFSMWKLKKALWISVYISYFCQLQITEIYKFILHQLIYNI